MKGLSSTKSKLFVNNQEYVYYNIKNIPGTQPNYWEKIPYSVRVLLEGVIRNSDEKNITIQDARYLASWKPIEDQREPIAFYPGRIVLQDFTGVPVMNDLAAMRSALAKRGDNPLKINPIIPVDLVIDHSVMVDSYANNNALTINAKVEFERNFERYQFFKWCEQSFTNFRVVPPATGIVHQVNLEYLSQSVLVRKQDNELVVFPDTLIGTDSHTTMINGLGVIGWGVGGIEAVAAMMGQPLEIPAPDVIGIKLSGKLPKGTTPTDLTLTIIQMLRKRGVVDKFIEFYGDGLDNLPVTDRAMIANMTPECGATVIFFPVDQRTLEYLTLTGKSMEQVNLVEEYYKKQGMFRDSTSVDPIYTDVIEMDLGSIVPSLAGPKRPQDRVPLDEVQDNFRSSLIKPKNQNGFGLSEEQINHEAGINFDGQHYSVKPGFLAIAAITSCTNTSNPFVMIAAGLVAKNAVELGLKVPKYVKTSLAPGSRVVTEYLNKSGLTKSLETLGFHTVGYGCTTCIGNSGPLANEVIHVIDKEKVLASAVLSGNRNFEGRINPYTQANYLASPPLVVAYALAGTIDINLAKDPIGYGTDQNPVFLSDIWPSSLEIQDLLNSSIGPDLFRKSYQDIFSGNSKWNDLQVEKSSLFNWSDSSTYLREPPFFLDSLSKKEPKTISDARVLLMLGDSITTDHISPAGSIALSSPAGKYLLDHDIQVQDFNSYGSRRGNDQVMTRGTFANIRIKNLLLAGTEGGYTIYHPTGDVMDIFSASQLYKKAGIPLIVIAGKEYGTGSSRDWAAKGPLLLGVKAVIAESFERIHRSNLVGMGILPLEFLPGQNANSLNLIGTEVINIEELFPIQPGKIITVRVENAQNEIKLIRVKLRIDTQIEIEYFQAGGIMNYILEEQSLE
ncbi:MAG: aconitate hydratase AcnA [Chloroflexi bacterium HGW-Chloroflexi-8]|nr:MAG: aconitate hydratase AcnA [Chloroflexi bacterium HGW-Chloroflexi-8]